MYSEISITEHLAMRCIINADCERARDSLSMRSLRTKSKDDNITVYARRIKTIISGVHNAIKATQRKKLLTSGSSPKSITPSTGRNSGEERAQALEQTPGEAPQYCSAALWLPSIRRDFFSLLKIFLGRRDNLLVQS